jgi:hypothetical protein
VLRVRREDLPTDGHVRVVGVLYAPGERLRAANPGDRLYVDDPARVPEEWLPDLEPYDPPPTGPVERLAVERPRKATRAKPTDGDA